VLYPEALTHVAFQRIARTELSFCVAWIMNVAALRSQRKLLDMVDGSRYQVGISA